MNVLLIGDIVGSPGRKIIEELLESLKREFSVELVIANGENAAGGVGITREIAKELFAIGIDVLTMGNHVWDKREAFSLLEDEENMVRPANYPSGAPGRGATVFHMNDGLKVGIINISGRIFMPPLDCPFQTVEKELDWLRKETLNIIVDFHAEATSEKIAMGWFLDGKVSAVVGTHTHVQTADETILPNGTAYLSDLGMTGPIQSVLGVEKSMVIDKMLTQLPVRFKVAKGPAQLCGAVINIDEKTGKAVSIQRIWRTLKEEKK